MGEGASRRTVLFGAGALGAAGVLAACGAGEAPDPAGTPSEPGATSAPTSPTPGDTSPAPAATNPALADGIPVAQIPVGGGVIDAGRRVVVTQPTAGQFRAFDPTCTHQACLVSTVGNGLITCACHGSQFRITDGSVARGPAREPLAEKSATVEGGVVVVR